MAPRRPLRFAALLLLVVLGGACVGVLGQSSSSTSSAAAPVAPVVPAEPGPTVTGLESTHPAPAELPPATRLGPQDGLVPDGVTVFDDAYAAVAELDPQLLTALRRAARDAAADHVTIFVNSGWRSAAYQERLLEDAVAKYGSVREAARWVATPATSLHVKGEAVDIGRSSAASWLSRHGAAYGLCRTYGNEPWHYELRPDAAARGCPRMYADPTRDPRMR